MGCYQHYDLLWPLPLLLHQTWMVTTCLIHLIHWILCLHWLGWNSNWYYTLVTLILNEPLAISVIQDGLKTSEIEPAELFLETESDNSTTSCDLPCFSYFSPELSGCGTLQWTRLWCDSGSYNPPWWTSCGNCRAGWPDNQPGWSQKEKKRPAILQLVQKNTLQLLPSWVFSSVAHVVHISVEQIHSM